MIISQEMKYDAIEKVKDGLKNEIESTDCNKETVIYLMEMVTRLIGQEAIENNDQFEYSLCFDENNKISLKKIFFINKLNHVLQIFI